MADLASATAECLASQPDRPTLALQAGFVSCRRDHYADGGRLILLVPFHHGEEDTD